MAKLISTLFNSALTIELDPSDFRDLCWDKEVIFHDEDTDKEVTIVLVREYHR